MKKTIILFFLFFSTTASIGFAQLSVNEIKDGSDNAKVKIFVYESLTCPHCAKFHKDVYPKLKKEYIDKGLVQIFFKSFPFDLAGLNAAKITHCTQDDKKLFFLNYLFETQTKWAKGNTIEDINGNLKKSLEEFGIKNIDIEKCIKNKDIENAILNERINAVSKYKINSTPTLIINEEKFDKSLNYKNLKKTIEKLI